jgi:hypothetical protein
VAATQVEGQISISLPSIKSSLEPPLAAELQQAAPPSTTKEAKAAAAEPPHPAKKPAGATSDPNVECVSLHNFMKSQGAETVKAAVTAKKPPRKRAVNQSTIGFKPQKAKATADGSPAKSTRSKASSKGKAPKKKGAKS